MSALAWAAIVAALLPAPSPSATPERPVCEVLSKCATTMGTRSA